MVRTKTLEKSFRRTEPTSFSPWGLRSSLGPVVVPMILVLVEASLPQLRPQSQTVNVLLSQAALQLVPTRHSSTKRMYSM